MRLGDFFHRGLIVASNTAYAEKAAKTKQFIDILDALLHYESKQKEVVLLSKEVEMVELFLRFVQYNCEHAMQYECHGNARFLGSIRHGDLLYRAVEIVEAAQTQNKVRHIAMHITEKSQGFVVRFMVNGSEIDGVDEEIPFVERGSAYV